MKKTVTLALATLALTFSSAYADVVSAYKIGGYTDVETAKSKLTSAGFEVLGTYKVDAGTTVLYTNDAMKAMGNKPTRALASVGRILVDDEHKQLSVANPIYFGKAFMQKEYDGVTSAATLASLEKAFGSMKDSEDKWEFDDLAKYHFMIGMPYYEDMDTVAEGTTAELVEKVKKAKGTVAVVKVGEDRYVAFVELDRRTNGFVKKIGTQNGGLLPWAVLIEDGKAKALSAKYFIAISYPLLTLDGFATIMTVPGAIEKDLKKVFK